jgi:inhibitor of KinA
VKVIESQLLGDQGVLLRLAQEEDVWSFAEALRQANWPEVVDIVPAYLSVAVFAHPAHGRLADLQARLLSFLSNCKSTKFVGRLHEIPCCYELGPDLAVVANATRLTSAEVIDCHSSTEYTVYAIGFVPGFPYMGYLPAPLCGVPRRSTPRLKVPAGSVGLTGRQTGIYPLERPGGWCLIGQTPLQIVDLEDGFFPLRVGDRVRFRPIGLGEFESLRGRRLGE